MVQSSPGAIPPQIRQRIVDSVLGAKIPLFGTLDDPTFLSHLYDLSQIATSDGRFSNARGDIWQHTVNNSDWDPDWFMADQRFDLLHAPDELFLKLLTEMLHPRVRPNLEQTKELLDLFNEELRPYGYEISPERKLGSAWTYTFANTLKGGAVAISSATRIADVLSSEYLTKQAASLQDAVTSSPTEAIGKAKEFVESVCKEILKRRTGAAVSAETKFPKLVKETVHSLELVPPGPDFQSARLPIQSIATSLGMIAEAEATLRNSFGTGHGKDASFKELATRHAALAVHAAIALSEFLLMTYLASPGKVATTSPPTP